MTTLADFDAQYDASTRAIIDAPDINDVLTLMGAAREIGMDNEYAFAFGNLRHRASVLLERLAATEARVAELVDQNDKLSARLSGLANADA